MSENKDEAISLAPQVTEKLQQLMTSRNSIDSQIKLILLTVVTTLGLDGKYDVSEDYKKLVKHNEPH